MNRTIHKLCAYSGIGVLVGMTIGFVLLAGFVPTPSPSMTATETAEFILGKRTRIRWGLIVCLFAEALLVPLTISMVTHMRRIEGRFPALTMIQLGLSGVGAFELLYVIFFWQAAAFRVDRAPELIQLLNDMAWLPMVGFASTAVLQVSCFGIAILMDRRERPILPRWLGYFNLWVAVMFLPGAFIVFFHTGPLAWNGIIAWYLPLAAFGAWLVLNPIYLSKAVDTMESDPGAEMPVTGNESVSAELTRLRAEVDELLARTAQ